MSKWLPCHCDVNHGPSVLCGGPAVYHAIRDGQPVLLCSRCILTSDSDKNYLEINQLPDVEVWQEYDPLGLLLYILQDFREGQSQE